MFIQSPHLTPQTIMAEQATAMEELAANVESQVTQLASMASKLSASEQVASEAQVNVRFFFFLFFFFSSILVDVFLYPYMCHFKTDGIHFSKKNNVGHKNNQCNGWHSIKIEKIRK